MRNYAKKQEFADLPRLTGDPFLVPHTALALSPDGGSLQSVHGIATGTGDVQAALSGGQFGTLVPAGRP